MPSTTRQTTLLAVAAAVVAVAAVTQQALFGAFLGAVVYTVGWVIWRLSPGSPFDDMTRERTLATGAVVLATLAYAVVAADVLLGVVVSLTVAVASWLTSPYGPVARWLDRRG
jgi:formate hydrogenlyase subunit 4